jgi:hypothetical protein
VDGWAREPPPADNERNGVNARTLIASALAAAVLVPVASADSTPVGPLPAGPVTTVTSKSHQLVAVALPQASGGAVWRIARSFDSRVVRQVSEANVGNTVVLVFRTQAPGRTSLVFALTRGDASSKALRSATTRLTVR